MTAGLKSRMHVLSEYFGRLPGQSLMDFAKETRALTEDEKNELSVGAAKNLGLTQPECDFPLK